jgi:hypothetical protein
LKKKKVSMEEAIFHTGRSQIPHWKKQKPSLEKSNAPAGGS